MASAAAESGRHAVDVPVLPSTTSYTHFCENFMAANKPCLIHGVAKSWKAWEEWRTKDGKLNRNAVMKAFQNCTVPVVKIDPAGQQSYGHATETMLFQDFFGNHFPANPSNPGKQLNSTKYYLKDWHYAIDFKDELAYKTPSFFSDDWLNAWWEKGRRKEGDENDRNSSNSDFKFLYLGAASTYTPLHHDVYKSYSWSASVCGRKRWILYHPDEEKNLKDKFNEVAPSGEWERLSEEQKRKFPMVKNVNRKIEITQEAGDAIFVPSGWYHEVHNVENCLSINHNWFNGFNLEIVFEYLKSEWMSTVNEIDDIRPLLANESDFLEEVQKLMHFNTGMNLVEFQKLICFMRDCIFKEEETSKQFTRKTLELIHKIHKEVEKLTNCPVGEKVVCKSVS